MYVCIQHVRYIVSTKRPPKWRLRSANNNGASAPLTFTELRERDGSIVDLIRTRPDIQTRFVANSHGRHFGQPYFCNENDGRVNAVGGRPTRDFALGAFLVAFSRTERQPPSLCIPRTVYVKSFTTKTVVAIRSIIPNIG